MPREFAAKDQNGEEIIIFVEHGVFDTSALRGQTRTFGKGRLPGLRTEDGRYVNYIAKGRYEIVDESATIPVTSDDPNAV